MSYGIKTYEQLRAVLDFYIDRKGPAIGFRFKDWMDFTTAPNHRAAPTPTDVQLEEVPGVANTYQLAKVYSSGPTTRRRIITKPVMGTVKVAVGGVEVTTGFSIDYAKGWITFDASPGGTVTAGCEFDVPVRFGKEVDELFAITVQDFGYGSVDQIPLKEVRVPVSAVSTVPVTPFTPIGPVPPLDPGGGTSGNAPGSSTPGSSDPGSSEGRWVRLE